MTHGRKDRDLPKLQVVADRLLIEVLISVLVGVQSLTKLIGYRFLPQYFPVSHLLLTYPKASSTVARLCKGGTRAGQSF